MRFEEFLGWLTCPLARGKGGWGEMVYPERARELCALAPHTLLYASSPLTLLSFILYNKLSNISIFLSYISHSNTFLNPKRKSWEPQFVAG